ncbi:hypothetical protein LOTGIDRAFT_160409 [Lottia gigantea]|uniref:Death domain-containing protein n=1 Tax=Lottia gigantea TaxID=225164 RepID=V4C1D9_LOTGI|nr:hypothetical protein LOTGIDRAFT_160409 [Lottia gigantea]ESO95289.1 hypothetical protein LOTGIDRAFT_160409 [Lottia gigantea]
MERPFIVKNVRDKVRHTLDILSDSDQDEDNISDDASMYSVSYPSDDFEESSDDNISQIEESKIFKELKLHSEIAVIVLEEDAQRYQSNDITFVRWTAEDRKMNQIPLTEDDFEITDIYRTTGLFTATEVSVEVKVNLPKTHISHHAIFEYFLLVETDNRWLTLPSTLTTSNGTSLTKLPDYMEISSICAIARRISEKVTVTEEGFEFVSELDTRLKLDFPKGAVDHNTDIEIQILPIDQERVRELKEYNPKLFNTILNMSDVVSVKYEHTKDFNKNVKIQLPMSSTIPNEDDFQPLFIRWNGTQPEILNDILSEVEPDVYSTAVSHFSDAAVVIANRHTRIEDTLYAVEIISGKSEACNILTFYTFGILGRQPSLWVELVLSKNKDEIRKKREAEGLTELPYSYSPDMQIKNQERVHVALKLNIEFPPGLCKSTFYLKFDKFCQSNHFIFPIVQKSRMCSPHYVAIEYEFSKSKEIHPVHFDPVTMKKNLLVPTKNQAQESLTQPSDDRKQTQRQNTGFGIERKGPRIAWSDQSSKNTTRTNQGQIHSHTNLLHRQTTKLSGNISLPSAQLARSSQSPQNTRGLNQGKIKCSESSQLNREMTRQPSYFLKPPLKLSLPSDQTETKSFEDPMFSEKSMMMLAKTYGNATGKELAICLGFSHADITIISDKTNGFDANFVVLVKWLQKTKSHRQERYGLLKRAFQSIDRGDLVELTERVRLENRGFTNTDKP